MNSTYNKKIDSLSLTQIAFHQLYEQIIIESWDFRSEDNKKAITRANKLSSIAIKIEKLAEQYNQAFNQKAVVE